MKTQQKDFGQHVNWTALSLSWLAAIVCCLVLLTPGCGFQPYRSDPQLPGRIGPLYLDTGDRMDDGFFATLRHQIRLNKILLAERPELATTILKIESNDLSRKVLSIGLNGHVLEHLLNYQVGFSMTTRSGREVFPLKTLSFRQSHRYNESDILSHHREETIVSTYLQQRAAEGITRYLATTIKETLTP